MLKKEDGDWKEKTRSARQEEVQCRRAAEAAFRPRRRRARVQKVPGEGGDMLHLFSPFPFRDRDVNGCDG
jgi:hypothetical protein